VDTDKTKTELGET